MRPSSRLLAFAAALLLLGASAALHAAGARGRRAATIETDRALVRELGLTDLCVFTEARYTRHPSQADRFAPFQDAPGAPEHFPSGSLAAPPPAP